MRIIWGTAYSVVAVTAVIGALLVTDSVRTKDCTRAVAGMVVFATGICTLRVCLDARWLKNARSSIDDARDRLTEERIQHAAEREVFALEVARTQRDLEAQERRNAETLAAERDRLSEQIAAEREQMLTELAANKAQIQRDAVRVAFVMARNGIAEHDAARAQVIALPVADPHARGTGTHHN